MGSSSRQRAKVWLTGGLSVFALSLVIAFADQLRCMGGDCTREWWISTLVLGSVGVSIAAGLVLLLSGRD